MKAIALLASGIALLCTLHSCGQREIEVLHRIPLYANTYYTAGPHTGSSLPKEGTAQWEEGTRYSSFVKVDTTGKLDVALYGRVPAKCRLRITAGNRQSELKVTQTGDNQTVVLPEIRVDEPGYVRLDIEGVSAEEGGYPLFSEILLGGEAARSGATYVPEGENWPYWGRRGPSVHLNYNVPAGNWQYFYNEITVPEGSDVIGSYFMANGHQHGYFGIQVNSENERRVLFSIWSPFETDNPKEIPDNQRVKILKYGRGVKVNDFGNEGSGGQSYMVYDWKAGQTYKFLTECKPDPDFKGYTRYTGWIGSPDGEWRLVSSMSRPPKDAAEQPSYYQRAHSFLENFQPSTGWIERDVRFDNQWVINADKTEWVAVHDARFTCDNTGNQGIRTDYAGGVDNLGRLILRNCGFFNDNTSPGKRFARSNTSMMPHIEFDMLHNLPGTTVVVKNLSN